MQKPFALIIILLVVELILALFAGPYSCEGGLQAYFYYGIAVLLISVVILLFYKGWTPNRKLLYIVLSILASAITWILGFFMGDFSILCSLF